MQCHAQESKCRAAAPENKTFLVIKKFQEPDFECSTNCTPVNTSSARGRIPTLRFYNTLFFQVVRPLSDPGNPAIIVPAYFPQEKIKYPECLKQEGALQRQSPISAQHAR
jgi:hypothetical protein